MRAAVVGHVEWIEFARVPEMPAAGEIVHAGEVWSEPAGGGAVAAVQLARLAGGCTLYTALGDDALGRRADRELAALGVRMEACWHETAQRRGFVHIDSQGERTITVIGVRLDPRGADPLPWPELGDAAAVYFTAGDGEALRLARGARVLTATARAMSSLAGSGVRLDALVASARDVGERYERGDLDPEPAVVVRTDGAAGGTWETAEGECGHWAATALTGPVVDAYGCGDSFAAGLTWGLAGGLGIPSAVELGARCGAACLTGRGPYSAQLTTPDP